jgi:glutathione synthase/RimK-type ligase-like ATP-grasp enzyme
MLLIIGIPSENPVRLLTEACDELQLPYRVFNQRQQQYWKLDLDYADFDNSIFSDGQGSYRIGDFSGIYLRTMDQTKVPEYETCGDKHSVDALYQRLFKLIDMAEGPRMVNRPTPMMSNNSKPFQSIIIAEHGLDVPASCITNNIEVAAAFIDSYPHVIYKSVSGTRSIVKQVDKHSLQQLYKVKYCPVQFQECVEGTNVRVHVVNDTVIATKICTDAVDYRYAHQEEKHTELEPMDLDLVTADKCVNLSKVLQLPFAGIDLMFTNDGRTICFEVNPSPGYSYYESNTGQLISHALAIHLSGK